MNTVGNTSCVCFCAVGTVHGGIALTSPPCHKKKTDQLSNKKVRSVTKRSEK